MLFLIAKETDTAKLEKLVEHVHEEVDAVTAPEQARIALVHKHFPKFADYDVIEYDERSETVRYHETQHLEQYLALAEEIGAQS
ncbi:DUF7344 domain-containing protein [Haladaptatus halobius]|uniref:DUF7344 domain-containing protein n=1 Tax=Haladaptatus halobius TaxID=2884875 RepID=UPI001D0B9A25|nr:hypothetical protein [Haladaptatus halobius]